MIYKDSENNSLHEGDRIKFYYGIPPTKGIVTIQKEKGILVVNDKKNEGMTMKEFMKYYGDTCTRIDN